MTLEEANAIMAEFGGDEVIKMETEDDGVDDEDPQTESIEDLPELEPLQDAVD